MEIIDIRPRGYCKGVVRAIQLAKKTRQAYPETPIHILGSLVHNHYIVNALERKHIKTVNNPLKSRLELLDEIEEGIVIFSAHGVSDAVRDHAKDKGLLVFDATCEDVSSTHDLISQAKTQGKEVIYIGKHQHPESLAVTETFHDIHFVSNLDEIKNLAIESDAEILVTNQTTLSTLEIQNLIQAITTRYPHAEINNEICFATRQRQEAILNQIDLDALIVVGDPMSNNTAMLAQIGKNKGIQHIFKIESLHQLDISLFKDNWKVGITSGASTPNYLTNMVSEYMKQLDLSRPTSFPEIDFERILD